MPLNSQGAVAYVKHFHLLQPLPQQQHLGNALKTVLDAFKAARLFSPFKFHELKPSTTDIDNLKAFPFLRSQETIVGLKMEIPMYMAASEDISTEIDLIAWW